MIISIGLPFLFFFFLFSFLLFSLHYLQSIIFYRCHSLQMQIDNYDGFQTNKESHPKYPNLPNVSDPRKKYKEKKIPNHCTREGKQRIRSLENTHIIKHDNPSHPSPTRAIQRLGWTRRQPLGRRSKSKSVQRQWTTVQGPRSPVAPAVDQASGFERVCLRDGGMAIWHFRWAEWSR